MCALTIRIARAADLGIDRKPGVQKFHSHWVPRLGGVPIFLAFFSALLMAAWLNPVPGDPFAALIVCTLPAFGIGLIEDLSGRAGIAIRLVFTMLSAALAWWLLGAVLLRLDIGLIDSLLRHSRLASFLLTIFCAAGVANAINIIDGYNGLSGFVATAAFAALAMVSASVGDPMLFTVSLISAASVLGFLCWNFPRGRIFLGDAGAYLIGFLIAVLCILLVDRHAQVSAWFPLLLMIYPVWETLFSMYRRALVRGGKVGQPDALHLHQLIYKRLVRQDPGPRDAAQQLRRNFTTSIYLWAMTLLCVIPAVMFHDDRNVLIGFCVLFVVAYGGLYRRLVRFKAPKTLILGAPALALLRPKKAV